MNHSLRQLLRIVTLIAGLVTTTIAQDTVPAGMTYQGRIVGTEGESVADGSSYQIEIRIWNAPTDGTLIWGARYSNVQLNAGTFNLILGAAGGESIPGAAINDISFAFTESERYMGITITKNHNGQAIATPLEILPRQQVLSTPYAFTAETAQNLVDPTLIVPSGLVAMWSGAISHIPNGWVLCDGANGTPDLRDRFVIGASSDENNQPVTKVTGNSTQTGGSATKDISHTHKLPFSGWGQTPSRDWIQNGRLHTTGNDGWTIFADTEPDSRIGGSTTQDVLNPYYALAFIMKR